MFYASWKYTTREIWDPPVHSHWNWFFSSELNSWPSLGTMVATHTARTHWSLLKKPWTDTHLHWLGKKKKLKLHVPDRLISFLKPFYLIHQTVFKKIISSGCNSQWFWNVFGWCLFIMAITVNAQLSTRYRAYLSYRPNDLSNSASACVHSTIKPYFPPVIGGTYLNLANRPVWHPRDKKVFLFFVFL